MRFIFFLIIVTLLSCNQQQREQKTILEKFDSIDQSLQQTPAAKDGLENSVTKAQFFTKESTAGIYNLLEHKWAGTARVAKLMQLKTQVNAFYSYKEDLQKQFFKYCGDTAGRELPYIAQDAISLTTAFFFGKEKKGTVFETQLRTLYKNMQSATANGTIVSKIDALKAGLTNDFVQKYFYNTPPMAVLVLLNKFEHDVRNTEHLILEDYLNEK
jgi:GldM N-terminal domain